jgi:hypothetical protein
VAVVLWLLVMVFLQVLSGSSATVSRPGAAPQLPRKSSFFVGVRA